MKIRTSSTIAHYKLVYIIWSQSMNFLFLSWDLHDVQHLTKILSEGITHLLVYYKDKKWKTMIFARMQFLKDKSTR